jgi:hypothetical protein
MGTDRLRGRRLAQDRNRVLEKNPSGILKLAIASRPHFESVTERHRTVRGLPVRVGSNSSMDRVVGSWEGHEPANSPHGPEKRELQPRLCPLQLRATKRTKYRSDRRLHRLSVSP